MKTHLHGFYSLTMEQVGFFPILNGSSALSPRPKLATLVSKFTVSCLGKQGASFLSTCCCLALCVCVGGGWGGEARLFSRGLGSCKRADLLIRLVPLKLLSKIKFVLITSFPETILEISKSPDLKVCASLLSVSFLNKVPCCNRCHNSEISFIRL